VSFVPVRRGDDELVRLHHPADPAGIDITSRAADLSRPRGTKLEVNGGEVDIATAR
jgi:hypothetical protein